MTIMISPENWTCPIVVVAGMGTMGREGDIPGEISKWLTKAELIVCPDAFIPTVEHFDADKAIIKAPLEPIIDRIKEASESRRVMVLASGDPLFYGIGRQLREALGKNRIVILPNITSVQYLFARLAIPWDDVLCFSLHREDRRDFFYWLRLGRKVAILTGPKTSPSFIARLTDSVGMGEMVDIAVGEKLGSTEERVVMASPKEIAAQEWQAPNVVALLPKGPSDRTGGFLDESNFQHEKGMITKREVRAIIVSALRLKPGDVLWDLGAGSGSVSIESCYRVPLKAVHAVEKNSARFRQLLENTRIFHCGEVIPHLGDATNLIYDLPDPDRVFLGGGGKSLGSIIKAICERFGSSRAPLIVISAVLWHSVNEALMAAKECSLSVAVRHIQVSRSFPILDSFRFEPLSPIFLISLEPNSKGTTP